ncbi:MAG: hypothetical protein OXF93_23150 [Acidobacteria bacterium]|nr:hypothetical protein [Acidobacteriota bacterium]
MTAAGGKRGRSGAADLAAVLATCHQPSWRGRGRESEQVALERGRLDAVIVGLLFMGGMRRSEVSALRWADVVDAADGDGVLVTVRRGKTNQARSRGEDGRVRRASGGGVRSVDAATIWGAASPTASSTTTSPGRGNGRASRGRSPVRDRGGRSF